MPDKRIVNCSITGANHTPTMSEYLPITPTEIAQSALDAANAGATTVHIHVRKDDGQATSDFEVYDKVMSLIRQKNKEIIICITTGGGLGWSMEERLSIVPHLKPQLCSMNSGSMNWGGPARAVTKYTEWKHEWEKPWMESIGEKFVFVNSFDDMKRALTVMNENGTRPELEVYDAGMLYNLKQLQKDGFLKDKPYIQFGLGIYGGVGGDPFDLINLKTTADRLFGVGEYNWSAFAAGKADYPINVQSLLLGGNVRLGLEDNLYVSKGRLAKSNAELIEKIVRIMKELDIEPATPAEGKQILEIKN